MLNKFLLALALLVALLAPPALAEESVHDAHLATTNGLRLLHGWTRATANDSVLLFVEIDNTSRQSVTLIGAHTPVAESATLVGFTLVDGAGQYIELPELAVASESEMILAPQGLALRLDGVSQALTEGEQFQATIQFTGFELPMTVDVEAKNATQHSHAGHSH